MSLVLMNEEKLKAWLRDIGVKELIFGGVKKQQDIRSQGRLINIPEPPSINIREVKARLLDELRVVIKSCKRCVLHGSRKNAVCGFGNPESRFVFVGEAPGFEEDMKGEPFVGRSGKLLTELIREHLNLGREDVFISNVIRCKPPKNREPKPEEIEMCKGYLFKELDIIRPKLVVALGSSAARAIIGKGEKVTSMRGKLFDAGAYKVFVTFHPAFVLRNPYYGSTLKDDFKTITEIK